MGFVTIMNPLIPFEIVAELETTCYVGISSWMFEILYWQRIIGNAEYSDSLSDPFIRVYKFYIHDELRWRQRNRKSPSPIVTMLQGIKEAVEKKTDRSYVIVHIYPLLED